jgi:hypothetical protein
MIAFELTTFQIGRHDWQIMTELEKSGRADEAMQN